MVKWLRYGLRALVAALMATPIYWVFVIATGKPGAAYSIPPVWRPRFHWAPLLYVWTHTPWSRYVLNSVFISAATILLVVVTSALAGYALAELKFPGNSLYFYLALGVMMLPQQALLVPQYVVMYHLHLLNTYTGLIVPFAASTSGIFLFRQFFMKLPGSYREIARLEGVGTLTYLRRVAVPLARPAVATTVLLTFISSWNQFQWPLIMTVSPGIQPIELALSHYMQAYQSHWRDLTSAALIALLPILVVFAFTQRHIVSAVAGGEAGQKE